MASELDNQLAFHNHEIEQARRRDVFNSMITAGQSAMKYMVVINGGACMAILAFISSVYDKYPAMAGSLSAAAAYFGLGVLFGAMVSGATYKSQFHYYQYNPTTNKWGEEWRRISIWFGLGSYAAFALGGVVTIFSLQ
jgi:hypothetical protein